MAAGAHWLGGLTKGSHCWSTGVADAHQTCIAEGLHHAAEDQIRTAAADHLVNRMNLTLLPHVRLYHHAWLIG